MIIKSNLGNEDNHKARKIIAVSAGQYEYKKEINPIKNEILYLNYGLLGLATVLNEQLGLDILVIQADNRSPSELIHRIEMENNDILNECECILLSIPSYYSVKWSNDFCRLIKERFNKRIIAGGRWVVDNNQEWIKTKIPCIDLIIEGFGEKKLAKLLCPDKSDLVSDGSLQCFDHLNYKLLLDYNLYQPSIEISRGCGSGCAFCADRGNKRLPNKPVQSIMRELDYLDETYGKGNYSVYFEAPHFHFDKKWCEELFKEIEHRNSKIQWRCTTRVESVPIDMIPSLAKSGLKILDIGLESASPTQLLKMNKTKNPEKYLSTVSKILEECKKYDVWVKLNILFYAGETYKTIKETESWLRNHMHLIKGVAISSLVYYKGYGELNDLLEAGAKLPLDSDLDGCGYINLDLSDEISCSEAKNIAARISQMVMTQKDYYDVKSVSYFKRGYTYDHFKIDVQKCETEKLPFRVMAEDNI
jgi:radical SAM superfamily enzyme